MIIPKPIVAEFNLAIIVLSLVFKRTSEVFFSKTLTGVAIEVLLAFPYQLAFLVIGFYGVPKWCCYLINNILYEDVRYGINFIVQI